MRRRRLRRRSGSGSGTGSGLFVAVQQGPQRVVLAVRAASKQLQEHGLCGAQRQRGDGWEAREGGASARHPSVPSGPESDLKNLMEIHSWQRTVLDRTPKNGARGAGERAPAVVRVTPAACCICCKAACGEVSKRKARPLV